MLAWMATVLGVRVLENEVVVGGNGRCGGRIGKLLGQCDGAGLHLLEDLEPECA